MSVGLTTRTRLCTVLLAGPLGLLSGCTLVANLDRFEQEKAQDEAKPQPSDVDAASPNGSDASVDAGSEDAGTEDLGCDNPRTMCLRLQNFSPHVDQLVVVDLVAEDHNLRARAMLDPMSHGGETTVDIVMPLAIPEDEVPAEGEDHPLHLEFWGDFNEDGEYTNGVDHRWNKSLPADGNLVFKHDTVFTDLVPRPTPIGKDFRLHLTEFGIHDGQMIEVMVIEVDSGRTVGLYRMQEGPANGDIEITIPGIIDPGGVIYRVELYADANDNRTYDDPPEDHAWVFDFIESNSDGLEVSFKHGGMFTELDYQFDFEP